jgi:hypothetical protein
MRSRRDVALLFALLVVAGSAGIASAQTSAPLPKTMSGRWTSVVPGVRTFTDSLSVVLDVPQGTGPLTGRLTLRGITCGALDEPLSGTWDGNELRMESQVRPNVNAQRANGECGTGRLSFKLTRKPGQSTFEGEALRDAAPVPSTVTLAP